MSFADEITEFKEHLQEAGKRHLTPGCVWAVVKDVDWDNKVMVATGVEDELDYFDVQLGIGSFYRKPAKGTLVMLGVPGLQDSASFLIECEAFEEAIYISEDSEFVIKEEGFIVKKGTENLGKILLDFMAECKKIVVVNGNTINQAAVTLIEERLKTVLIEE